MQQIRMFVDGRWVDGGTTKTLVSKFDASPLACVHTASAEQVSQATRAVAAAQRETRWAPYDRFVVLARAAELVRQHAADFTRSIVDDTGFVWGDAEREVERTVQTLLLSGEEAKRVTGELVPVSSAPGGASRLAFTTRRPRGVVCAITPFNSPLNTVAHKVAPALAAGNGVVLKPSAYTPLTANKLVETLLEAGLPPGLIAVLHGSGSEVGEWLLNDPIPAFYAFTGSTEVGLRIRRTIGLRPAQLELGSLASTIVCADADLASCVPKVTAACFRKAGQVCTSVQRLYVERAVLPDFTAAMREQVAGREAGDPLLPATFIGPVISAGDAERIKGCIDQAIAQGATLVLGGGRTGTLVEPTILTDVTTSMDVMTRETFGPVVSIRPFDDYQAALAEADDTPYGLAAGIFTRDIDRALSGASQLRMGSVHINETSNSRLDLMPFGGVKASGSGKEGPHHAIREMTEERLITISPSSDGPLSVWDY
jgi:acyl-CoA reductase-like NAD-dependent aldehyde dehydrogenase